MGAGERGGGGGGAEGGVAEVEGVGFGEGEEGGGEVIAYGFEGCFFAGLGRFHERDMRGEGMRRVVMGGEVLGV